MSRGKEPVGDGTIHRPFESDSSGVKMNFLWDDAVVHVPPHIYQIGSYSISSKYHKRGCCAKHVTRRWAQPLIAGFDAVFYSGCPFPSLIKLTKLTVTCPVHPASQSL